MSSGAALLAPWGGTESSSNLSLASGRTLSAPSRKTASDDHDSTPEEQFSSPSGCDSDHFMRPNQSRSLPRWTILGIGNTIILFVAPPVLFWIYSDG